MIVKLRRKMTILVACFLLVVFAGIIGAINYMNWRSITGQASQTLDILEQNSGVRPVLEQPRLKPDSKPDEKRGIRGEPPEIDNTQASLSNYYVITVDADGEVTEWKSDRSDLYSDEQIEDITQTVLASGRKNGRVGTQFFRVCTSRDPDNDSKMLIVLDLRLEIMNMRSVLRLSILASAAAYLLLCLAAYLLIRRMLRPVQESFDKQRQFVWDASHELKTPLAVIGTNAQVLEEEIGSNEYLGYITSEVTRTNKLLNDLLSLARMDKKTVQPDFKEFDLGKAILSVALPFESTVYEAGKTLETDIPDGLTCTGDEQMIRQLTVILLGNALKYSDEGGTITVRAGKKGKTCFLEVKNTGEGIAAEDLDKIFDRFYRADKAHNREVEGFGLGLSIAKNIVELHKGKIKVESEQGKETTFTVVFPVA